MLLVVVGEVLEILGSEQLSAALSSLSLSLSLVKNLEPFAEALLLGLLFYLRSLLLSITKQLHQRPLCALSTLKSLSVSKEAAAWCAQHLSWPELVL